jgi:hypothetical protein
MNSNLLNSSQEDVIRLIVEEIADVKELLQENSR